MLKAICKETLIHFLRNKKLLLKEKSKMLSGKMYNPAFDISLFIERQNCKKRCAEFNNLSPENLREQNKILSKIFGKTGMAFMLAQPFMCDYGYNIELGENFCSNHNLLILDSAKVTFGSNTMVGPNCTFITTTHPLDAETRRTGIQVAKPITIGNDVWICANVTILAGVTIGDNSVIGAGSIVSKDIPPNVLAIGNPCKIVKQIG